jgi:FKBP-type peptidyl-prolyl cis-trans isomerase FkpA
MKFRFIIFCLAIISLASCNKEDEILARNIEEIEEYIADNNLSNVEKTASGLHYIVTKEGDGNFPDINSTVTVKYTGYLTSNTIFDSNPNSQFPLANVIEGWQEGIPKFSKGGEGILLIPSKLGYGTKGAGSTIPGNAVLIFEVELLDF